MSVSMATSIDARFMNYRCHTAPSFRATYMRRRTQILRKYAASLDASAHTSGTANEKQFDAKERREFLKRYIDVRKRLLVQQFYSSTFERNSLLSVSQDTQTRSRSGSMASVENSIRGSAADVQHPLSEATAVQKVRVVELHKKAITAVRICRDGTRYACCSDDGSVSVHSSDSILERDFVVLSGHTGPCTDIHWLPNDWLCSSSVDATMRLWDAENGTLIRTCRDPSGKAIVTFAVSPTNGNCVCTANDTGVLQILNLSTGRYSKAKVLTGTTVTTVCFNDFGDMVITGSSNGIVTVFRLDLSSAKLSCTKQFRIMGKMSITSLSFATMVRHDGNVSPMLLCSIAADVLLLLRFSDTGSLILYKKYPVSHRRLSIRSCFSFSLSGSNEDMLVVSGGEDGKVSLFDVSRRRKSKLTELQAHEAPVQAVSCCYDDFHGQCFIVSGDTDGKLMQWTLSQQ